MMMMSESKEKENKVSMSLLSSLPDELVLSCIARLSRSDYAALSLVSKRYHSLVVSPDLYKMRSLMGSAEKCLYMCLSTRGSKSETPSWFFLNREKSLSPIPSSPSQPLKGCSLVALDWGIYAIGGWTKGEHNNALCDVMLLDCRTHTWSHVPSMRVARIFPAVAVIDGKIYVIGGCEATDNSLCWGEVFDPKTQTWDNLVQLTDRTSDDHVSESMVMDEKVYTMSERGIVYYSPNESRWVRMKETNDYSKVEVFYSYFVDPQVEVVYSYCFGTGKLIYCINRLGSVFWSESDEMEWKEVKGLEALLCLCNQSNTWVLYGQLKNFGSNILLICYANGDTRDIWCSEISLERSVDKREVWGTIKWSQAVASKLDLPCGQDIVCAYVNI